MSKGEILIIGGAGFIGSHVNKRLNEAGYSTVVFDNLSRGNRSAVIKGSFIQGDLGDPAAVKKVLNSRRFDAVMHFAALTDVGESMVKPLKYYRQNVINTIVLLEEIMAARPCPLIFSSSAAVYGIPEYIPLDEQHPCRPINPYGATKKVMEDLLIDCSNASDKFTFCALRYFNAAGGDPDGQIKIVRQTENNLIPIVLKNLINNNLSATVFGNDYDTPDGTCIRDYIHVMDLAEAHLLAMEKLLNGSKSMIYNLGNGSGFSVLEVLNAIQKVTQIQIDVKIGPRRAGDPPALLADASKARDLLGWTPRYPSLEAMVEHAWNAMNVSESVK